MYLVKILKDIYNEKLHLSLMESAICYDPQFN